jgi:hypothetical protein
MGAGSSVDKKGDNAAPADIEGTDPDMAAFLRDRNETFHLMQNQKLSLEALLEVSSLQQAKPQTPVAVEIQFCPNS